MNKRKTFMDKRKKETIIKAVPGAWFSTAIILLPLKNSEEGKQSKDKYLRKALVRFIGK